MEINITKYIDNINNYQKKFNVLQKISFYDKIYIDDDGMLFIQKKTPWRYINRKMNNQNRTRLADYLSININEYIKNIELLVNLFDAHNDIKKILENVIIYITGILGGIVNLRNYYNLKNDANKISMTLESTNNRLNAVMTKMRIKLII
jgi:hypothetical protein